MERAPQQQHHHNQQQQQQFQFREPQQQQHQPLQQQLEVTIRRVGIEDHMNIIKLFQTFDREKYGFMEACESQNNNSSKTSLSLAGLRIDERGGIYLNPLLDSNSAYFKCYVAEDVSSGQLIGYILFFNTLDDRSIDDPVAVIEDLFVRQEFRGRGIATQLWKKALKSSLDRGCFSCECLLIADSLEGLKFWQSKVGKKRIDDLTAAACAGKRSQHPQMVMELSREEMRQLLDDQQGPMT